MKIRSFTSGKRFCFPKSGRFGSLSAFSQMSHSLPTVVIKQADQIRISTGHPWIYKGNILKFPSEIEDGDEVQVRDHRRRFLGVGFYNSQSRIHVRVLSRAKRSLDRSFFEKRIKAAVSLRERRFTGRGAVRLINAESDLLSGLIVDRYGDALVVQTSSLGMDQRLPMLCEILRDVTGARVIVERNDIGSRKFEGLESRTGILAGDRDAAKVSFSMNDVRLQLDLLEGHKTGCYLDQQDNYQAVAELCRGRKLLDCFTFMGGFAIHAAKAGAASVLGLDQSDGAIASAKTHAELNGVSGRCAWENANVFDWLKEKAKLVKSGQAEREFDAIILDPPSFTRSRANLDQALRGYKEIHLRALQILKPGGVLASFCCSHHVDSFEFEQIIQAAAVDAGVLLRRTAIYSQSGDHPIIPLIPETEYLKGYAYEVLSE